MHTPTRRPLLLVGADIREYHAYSLLQVAATHPLVLVDHAVPAWVRPYLAGEVTADLGDSRQVRQAVAAFAAEHEVGAVLTYAARHAELTAHLAQQLDLHGSAPAAVAACHDEAGFRQVLDEHALDSGQSFTVEAEDSAVEAARLLGYPVSLRAPGAEENGASLRAHSDDEVRAAFQRICRDEAHILGPFAPTSAVVEEVGLDGPPVGVEAVVTGPAGIQTVAITRIKANPRLPGQVLGYSVDAHDPLLHDKAIDQCVVQAVTACGITSGIVHVQLRLSSRGPRLTALNACLPGDLVPLLVARALGISLPQVAATLATGTVPALSPTREGAAAVRFLYPDATGQIKRLRPPSEFATQPWLDRFAWTQQPGNAVLAPPSSGLKDRLAHWVVTGADAAACNARLDLVAGHVSAHISSPDSHPLGVR
ncbi:hypothetical protein QFZ24_010041 [Streptomyces phaeochromogenes]|uniref:carboxylase n=1 Tax=Streptomyces phaeochromogenes TaxID=1923 RepID=UPI002792E879|nr:carboxylase [Streptomyces phaeochromogenes]MDQ0956032.1 hypothetical protein [Streptomyces phaeochromogenes]